MTNCVFSGLLIT